MKIFNVDFPFILIVKSMMNLIIGLNFMFYSREFTLYQREENRVFWCEKIKEYKNKTLK